MKGYCVCFMSSEDEDNFDHPSSPTSKASKGNNRALDLLDSSVKPTMRRQVPPGLSEEEKLTWHKKEDSRIAREEAKLDAQRLKAKRADDASSRKEVQAQTAAEAKAAKAEAAKVTVCCFI